MDAGVISTRGSGKRGVVEINGEPIDQSMWVEVATDHFTFEELVERGAYMFFCWNIGMAEQTFIALPMTEEERAFETLKGMHIRTIDGIRMGHYRISCHPLQKSEYMDMIDLFLETEG